MPSTPLLNSRSSAGGKDSSSSASFFLRVELLDLVNLPSGSKLNESHVLQYLHKFLKERWAVVYRTIDLKPLVVGQQGGTSRAALPVFVSLREFLAFQDKGGDLHLSSTQKKAYWFRFAIELASLQEAGLIRDAVKFVQQGVGAESGDRPLLDRKSFELCLIEFRYFSLLLWLQAFRWRLSLAPSSRAAAISAANSEASPRSGGRPRSVSDGLLESSWSAVCRDVKRNPSLSPRQQSRTDAFFSTHTGLEESQAFVKEVFLDALPTILCIIGFHFNTALSATANDTASSEGTPGSEDVVSQTEACLSGHHLKYLALLLQLRQGTDLKKGTKTSTPPKRAPSSSRTLENILYSDLQRDGIAHEAAISPLVPIQAFVTWFRSTICLSLASVDLLSSSSLHPTSALTLSIRRHRNDRSAVNTQLSPRAFLQGFDLEETGKRSHGFSRHRSASSEHFLVVGRRRDAMTLPSGMASNGHRMDLTILDCTDCTIYALTSFRNVRVSHCRNCIIIVPCVSSSLIAQNCKNVSLHAACVGLVIVNCYDVNVHTLAVTPPVIAGDTRDLTIGPYNVVFDGQRALMQAARFDFTASTVNGFAQSIIVPVTGANKASTPRDDSLGRSLGMQRSRTDSGSLRSFASSLEESLAPNLQRASDISLLILPKQADQVTDNSNLVLPEIYANALLERRTERERALRQLLDRVGSLDNEQQRDAFMRKVEARFVEWLQWSAPKRYHNVALLARQTDS